MSNIYELYYFKILSKLFYFFDVFYFYILVSFITHMYVNAYLLFVQKK